MTQLVKYRFELFLVSQVAILFGSLIIPSAIVDILSPLLFFLNVMAGSLFIGTHKRYHLRLIILCFVLGGLLVFSPWILPEQNFINYFTFTLLFVFHVIVTYQIIRQIWIALKVDKTVIFGMMSGYISLGLVGFFIFLSLEILNPGSFSGLYLAETAPHNLTERLMYYSYITLMTIGYGEITPLTLLTQKASILVGLCGQFYMVIVTAIIVGKFINQASTK